MPFEPKGGLRDYRNELQRALRSLRPSSTSILHAECGAPDGGFADLENVLLYNLGTGCYAHLARRGVVCRRMHSVDHLHRLTYFIAEPTEVSAPTGQVLASADLADMPHGTTATHWWALLRDHVRARTGTPHGAQFGVEVDVGAGWTGDLGPAIKTFSMDLVAAMHVHDGSERERVTTALGTVGDGDRLWTLLNDPAQALLGRR